MRILGGVAVARRVSRSAQVSAAPDVLTQGGGVAWACATKEPSGAMTATPQPVVAVAAPFPNRWSTFYNVISCMHDTTHKSVAMLARFDRMLRLIVLLQTKNEYMIQRCWLRMAENSRMRASCLPCVAVHARLRMAENSRMHLWNITLCIV